MRIKFRFIVIEGPDGSGKTTIANELRNFLSKNGYKVLLTKEPTNNEIGELIKRFIRKDLKLDLDLNYSLACLFFADRYLHQKTIKEYLKDGYVVISDRYYHSSFVYQSILEDFDLEWLKNLKKYILKPDVVFVLRVDFDKILSRIKERDPTKRNIYENENFLEKIYKKYYRLHEILPDENIIYVNNNNSIEYTLSNLISYLI